MSFASSRQGPKSRTATREGIGQAMPAAAGGDETHSLLVRLLHDDPEAWAALIREYSGLLIRVAERTFAAYGYAPVAQDAEDVVAVVWSNVLADDRRIIRRCLAQGHWLATLYTLARNRAVDVMRACRLKTVPLNEAERAPEIEAEPAFEQPEIRPERMRAALQTLTARERTLVHLCFLQGRKYSEMAALTGIAQNSIGPTLGRALVKLRDQLQAPGK